MEIARLMFLNACVYQVEIEIFVATFYFLYIASMSD